MGARRRRSMSARLAARAACLSVQRRAAASTPCQKRASAEQFKRTTRSQKRRLRRRRSRWAFGLVPPSPRSRAGLGPPRGALVSGCASAEQETAQYVSRAARGSDARYRSAVQHSVLRRCAALYARKPRPRATHHADASRRGEGGQNAARRSALCCRCSSGMRR